ncbi:MAG: nucleotide pyrophosphohydrolase [Nanoarchaeota archaeon]|nr:nucleotide pyrophosphohydrolase [Nanoarchaeota archaeon]MBU2520406.1 nucleotide pyrophosphohydrolase [Nanoarchaeota archaeon]
MKESFDELFRTVKLDRKNSNFSQRCTLESRYKELLSEIEEIEKAIENGDLKNLKEELGDALWDLMFLFAIAEEKQIDPKDVIEEVIEKIKRRKPWIFTGEKLSIDEEIERWKKVKKQEKSQKS